MENKDQVITSDYTTCQPGMDHCALVFFGKCVQKNLTSHEHKWYCGHGLRECRNLMFDKGPKQMKMYFNEPIDRVKKKIELCGQIRYG